MRPTVQPEEEPILFVLLLTIHFSGAYQKMAGYPVHEFKYPCLTKKIEPI